jgi:hypothetical protein
MEPQTKIVKSLQAPLARLWLYGLRNKPRVRVETVRTGGWRWRGSTVLRRTTNTPQNAR